MTERQPALLPLARDPITFTVPGVPFPKGRPRVQILQKRSGGGVHYFPHVYTPQETIDAERAFLAAAKAHRPARPLTGALRVEILFVLPVAKSIKASEAAARVTGAELPAKKPDIDNMIKLVADALNEIFWRDDAQICDLRARKIYGTDPRTEVRITPIVEE